MAKKNVEAVEAVEAEETKAETLEDFLLGNLPILEDKVKVSDRIPFLFTIKAMDNETYKSLQDKHTKMYKKGRMKFDGAGFNMGLILECCIEPNFKSADFVKKAGVLTPEDAVRKLLLPGEIVNLASYIQELSGFDKDTEELKDEVKNY